MFRSDGTEGSASPNEGAERADSPGLVDDVKEEWRFLWRDRIDDKVRAEGIANRQYPLLFVDRGMVIIATRNFKSPNLKEILRRHEITNWARVLPPHPSVGGWGKFSRTVLNKQKRCRRHKKPSCRSSPVGGKSLPLRKGGRGWLHRHMKP